MRRAATALSATARNDLRLILRRGVTPARRRIVYRLLQRPVAAAGILTLETSAGFLERRFAIDHDIDTGRPEESAGVRTFARAVLSRERGLSTRSARPLTGTHIVVNDALIARKATNGCIQRQVDARPRSD
jgi:hypothetical protein